MEYWNSALCPNCTSRMRGWVCFQGALAFRVKTLGEVLVALSGRKKVSTP
jgi:hypothetical protein